VSNKVKERLILAILEIKRRSVHDFVHNNVLLGQKKYRCFIFLRHPQGSKLWHGFHKVHVKWGPQ